MLLMFGGCSSTVYRPICQNIFVSMNIYNLQEFKCASCTKWFHPHTSIPFSLACSHSICAQCLSSCQKRSKTSIICCHHSIAQSIVGVKVNMHIQQALQRLLKNTAQVPNHSNFQGKRDLMDRCMKGKEDDLKAFTELLEQIYNNEINRILSLKNRVFREIRDPASSLSQWKKMMETSKDTQQIEEFGKIVQDKIKELADLNLEQMAQTIIADPSICLQRHFSIYTMSGRQQRKTLKSSMKPLNEHVSHKSTMASISHPSKQNIVINFVKTLDSPIKQQKNAQFCKQLSSFKLEQNRSPKSNSRVDLDKYYHKRQPSKQITFMETNGKTTVRDFEQSKCSFKSKLFYDQREKRMSDKFQDLISSLKCNDQELIYSPDCQSIEEELLLQEEHKTDVNFLKQYEIQKNNPQKELQIRQKTQINSQKEKNKYIKRMEAVRTEEAFYNTNVNGNTIELFNTDLKQVNLKAFLDRFDWKNIEVIKFIGTGMQDSQLNLILNYMINGKIHSLLLSNNELEEISLDALIRFTEINKSLKSVSLQKNSIHQLHTNAKAKIALLKKRGVVVYI